MMGDLITVASTEELGGELQRLRGELQAAKLQLDSILRGSTGYAIVLVDSSLRLLHSNVNADELFSLTHLPAGAEVLNPAKICSVLQVQSLAEIEAALRTQGRWEAEVAVSCGSSADVQPRQVQMVITSTATGPVDAAEAAGYLLIGRDVSDQRRRERALLESQRMDSIGLLAGGIAHDFNNILMGILGYAGLAQDLIGRGHAAFRMLETIERSAERASYLTGQLLAYSRGGKMQSVYVNMDEMVADMLNIIGSNISKQINMVHIPSANLPWVVEVRAVRPGLVEREDRT
jgi:nitrogen-specific signal transduction histidine kinase